MPPTSVSILILVPGLYGTESANRSGRVFQRVVCAEDHCAYAMMGGPPQAMVQGGLPQATVQPVAATPSVNVPAILYRDAKAYSASLPRQRAADYGGCRRIKFPASGALGFLSCCVAYSYVIGCKDCLWTPLTCVLFPLPFFIILSPFSVCSPCLHCAGERQGNQWFDREYGEKMGAWVIVDAEKKTIAFYGRT